MNAKFKKNGTVISNAFSNTFPVQDMQTIVLSDKSAWALIFEHNCKGGTVLFTSYDEVMNTQTVNKYSRLNLLNNSGFKAKSDGKYEFMLRYPDDTTNYNRWRQTNNPCNEYKGTSDGTLYADGYEAVSIAWTSNYWGGLTRQNSASNNISPCFLSGSVGHSNWHYAIGANGTHNTGIPSCGSLSSTSSTAGRVQLWVRIDNTNISSMFSIYDKCIIANDFIEI